MDDRTYYYGLTLEAYTEDADDLITEIIMAGLEALEGRTDIVYAIAVEKLDDPDSVNPVVQELHIHLPGPVTDSL